MTSPITSTTSTPSAIPTPSAQPSSAAIGKDAFLKLLIAQMSHQDPLQPMDGTQFVTQLAQFTAVEQATAQSQKLDAISAQLSGISANDALSLVGKQVTLRGQRLAFDGVTPASANASLSGPAASVKVSITDAGGKVIRTLDLGARPAGAFPVTWDGRDGSGQPVAAGSYGYTVTATTAGGATVASSQDVTGVVSQITFDKGYPAIVLTSGATAPISDLVSAGTPPSP
jgi:flagellar basal-body rod modification protein FlgD